MKQEYIALFPIILLFLEIRSPVNGIQVHEEEEDSGEVELSTVPVFELTTTNNVNATINETQMHSPAATESLMVEKITSSELKGVENTTEITNEYVSTSAMRTNTRPEAVVNKKRQLFNRHGSYVIGSSESRNKDIEQRESKEEPSSKRQEKSKKEFRPSPELRITSPLFGGGSTGSGKYFPTSPYSSNSPVMTYNSNEEKFKWHTTHGNYPNSQIKPKLTNEYPKFEAILKEKQSQENYQQQLFHRQQNSDTSYHAPDNKSKVVWVASEPSFNSKPDEIESDKYKPTENETDASPTPTFYPTIYVPSSNEGHESPFSSGNGFGSPTFGYPGIDSDMDAILKASDKPDVPTVPDYIIKANENAKGQYPHGGGLRQHGHHKEHLWKGVFKLLAAAVPLGLLFSALTPNVVIVNANSSSRIPTFPKPPPIQKPVNLYAGRLRDATEKGTSNTVPPNYITDLLNTFNVNHVDPGQSPTMSKVCEDRYFCELGRLGSRPNSDGNSTQFLQKILWKIALEIPGFQTKQPSRIVFDAIEEDSCARFYCKNFDNFKEVNKYESIESRL